MPGWAWAASSMPSASTRVPAGEPGPVRNRQQGDPSGVVVDDDHGFTVSSVPAGWVADFGFYTPTARKDTVIPNQVRDLSRPSLLGREQGGVVFLVSDVSDNHNDTSDTR